MKISDKISMCLRNLWRRKMRTFLTTFGVVIGTCAIIVMVSLGVGMDKAQSDMLEGMGNLTLINVYEGYDYETYQAMQAMGRDMSNPPKLNYDAVRQMKQLPNVRAATPMEYLWEEVVLHVDERYCYRGNVIGIDMESMEAFGFSLEEGRFPTKSEYKTAVVAGSQAAYRFTDTKRKRDNSVSPYPDEYGRIKDPFVDLQKDRLLCNINKQDNGSYYDDNQKVPTGNGTYPMKVTGVLKTDDEGMVDRDFNTRSAVYIDVTRAQELRKEYQKKNKIRSSADTSYNQVYVMADSIDTVEAVEAAIKNLGYSTYSLSSQRKEMQKSTRTIQMILGGLAGISLLVAALGITNTMIMSIYERTREIGIMKVLGCVVGNIRTIFLMEAGCIGLLGGVLGIGISYGISFMLNVILNKASGDGGMMMGGMYGWSMGGMTQYSIIPSWLVAGALAFAVCIGLASGFYPANRAVKISALEAIKHE
ncbi:MAG: ABC transporter permease [Provencibacterium sp.]|jgi:ABC-type antimicrobial peptide transport system permease subunit|nr:ABC transporter permease [Provencibacterium sp.]